MNPDGHGWEDCPAVLIFADEAAPLAAARLAAESVGARILGAETLDAAIDRLERQAAVDAVLIELSAGHFGDAQKRDRLLEWANHAVRADGTAIVLSLPKAIVDDVYDRVDEPEIVMLVDPVAGDRAAALGLALATRQSRLHDHGLEADAERLRRLSEEVARIARALAELSEAGRTVGHRPQGPRASGELLFDAAMIRGWIRLRRLREQFFAKELFADPAWDMLLDLTAARLEGTRVAVSSLCIAAAVPATTALRWIRTLTEHGLFVRVADKEDGRRIFIELSDAAYESMAAYLQTLQQAGALPNGAV